MTTKASKGTPRLYFDERSGVAVISTNPTPNCLDGTISGGVCRIEGNYDKKNACWGIPEDKLRAFRLIVSAVNAYDKGVELARAVLNTTNKGPSGFELEKQINLASDFLRLAGEEE